MQFFADFYRFAAIQPRLANVCLCVCQKVPGFSLVIMLWSLSSQDRRGIRISSISLWFWGLLACPDLCCNGSLHNKTSWDISGVHSFRSLTGNSINNNSSRKLCQSLITRQFPLKYCSPLCHCCPPSPTFHPWLLLVFGGAWAFSSWKSILKSKQTSFVTLKLQINIS